MTTHPLRFEFDTAIVKEGDPGIISWTDFMDINHEYIVPTGDQEAHTEAFTFPQMEY